MQQCDTWLFSGFDHLAAVLILEQFNSHFILPFCCVLNVFLQQSVCARLCACMCTCVRAHGHIFLQNNSSVAEYFPRKIQMVLA